MPFWPNAGPEPRPELGIAGSGLDISCPYLVDSGSWSFAWLVQTGGNLGEQVHVVLLRVVISHNVLVHQGGVIRVHRRDLMAFILQIVAEGLHRSTGRTLHRHTEAFE